ncbi:entericidin EcnA/B family protein [Sphingomonas alba]|uniref:Entericidin EcnA/B family protein n=1 Tax=Sphingomonas alba TaxID=2908208 RepID=A0ABT0RPG2_9SPHN|nr:entericidin EcnA/B family protein [Sphingomonas alba]MCL6684546.1 entericidin EcnA/B family protein [Sphingomonas alba]
MFRKIATMALITVGLTIGGCNTVRGAGQDVQSAANCTENVIHQGNC